MATFEEAFDAAIRQLDDHGRLLNFELLRIVNQDEERFREIRELLIFEGIATDRFGVGLIRAPESDRAEAVVTTEEIGSQTESQSAEEITFCGLEESSTEDWRVMTAGVTRGPFSFEAIRSMWRSGEINSLDLLRQGEWGIWHRPDELEFLSNIKPRPNNAAVPVLSNALPVFVPDSINHQKFFTEDAREVARIEQRSNSVPPNSVGIAQIESSITNEAGEVRYYLWDSGVSVGPISRHDIETQLQSGRIDLEEMVQVGSDGDWQPLSRALGLPQPPLKISRNKGKTPSEIALPTSAPLPEARPPGSELAKEKPRAATEKRVSLAGPSQRNSRSSKHPRAEGTRSTLGTIWHQAAGLVGGSRWLGIILGTVSTVALVIVYLCQPPSSQKICLEVQSSYEKLMKMRSNSSAFQGIGSMPQILLTEASKVRGFRDILKVRASASRPGDQELFWACEYGLLPLLEHQNSEEYEKLFLDHMKNAMRELGPLPLSAEKNENKPSK